MYLMLLRAEFLPFVRTLQDEIRDKYPIRKSEVEFLVEKARRELFKYADLIETENLVHKRRYGMLEFSSNATAFAARTRAELKNHGDVYITVWTWDAEHGVFWCNTAWGSIGERRPHQSMSPIIELSEET